LISGIEKLIAKKRDIKQGAMQKLLSPTEGWAVKEFGELTEQIVGGGTPSRINPLFWGNEIPWVTVKDFATFNPIQTQEYITKEGLKNSASHLIPKGIIITSTRMALGKAVIYEVDVSINQDLKAIFLKKNVDTKFFFYWFQFNSKFIADLGSGSTVMGLSLPDLRKIKVALPPLEEQTRIATILSDMDAEIATLENKLEKYRAVKAGMMQNLLTGRIRLV
jgi:type I restriction enzyme, S subunit